MVRFFRKLRQPWIMMLLVCVGSLLLAGAVFYWGGLTEATVAHGALIPPDQQALPSQWEVHSQDYHFQSTLNEFSGQWLLATVHEQCDETCLQDVIRLRQLRTSLGKNEHRLSRLLVILGGRRVDEARLPRGMWVLYASPEQRSLWQSVEHTWLLIDPKGLWVMKYAQPVALKGVRQDLSRLFSTSHA